MLNVKINVHPFELDNALTRLHSWSHQYDWEHRRPDITVELNVVLDHHGHAEKLDGDRFAYPEAKPMTTEPEQSANEILSMIRNQDQTPPAFSLMNHLKEKARG